MWWWFGNKIELGMPTANRGQQESIKFKGGHMKKVFLGGTCKESKWRDKLIKQLKIDYFDPVVPDWNEEAYKKELKERKNSDYCLYVITPKMTGVYAIAEVIDDSNKRPEKTVFCFLLEDDNKVFDKAQIKSLTAVATMVEKNGGKFCGSLKEVADYLNKYSHIHTGKK